MAKGASLKMREKWDEILKRRQTRIEGQIQVYEDRLKLKIREEVMEDFQIEEVLQKRDEIKRDRDEKLAKLKADFEAEKAKMDRSLFDFERKIARAFGVTHCRTEVRHEEEFQRVGDPINAEIDRRLEQQNGSLSKIRDRFRDASEEIWLSDAGNDVKVILDTLEIDVAQIAVGAVEKAPSLPVPKKIEFNEIKKKKKTSKKPKKR